MQISPCLNLTFINHIFHFKEIINYLIITYIPCKDMNHDIFRYKLRFPFNLQALTSTFILFSLKCYSMYLLDCTLSDFDMVLSMSGILVFVMSDVDLSLPSNVDCLPIDIFPSETGMVKEEDLAENLNMLFSFQSRTVVFEQQKLKKIKHPCRQMSAVDK